MEQQLSAIDANFWHIDRATTRQVIASFCLLAAVPDRKELETRLSAALDKFPRLKHKVSLKGSLCWVEDPNFSLSKHFEYLELRGSPSVQAIVSTAEDLFSQELTENVPPWKFFVIHFEAPGDGEVQAATLLCVHHALADGMSTYEILNTLCQDTAPSASTDKPSEPAKLRYSSSKALTISGNLASLRQVLGEILSFRAKSPFTGINSGTRKVAVRSFPFASLQKVRTSFKTSSQDVMLSIIAGAARRFQRSENCPISNIRAIIPFNLRDQNNRFTLGNKLSGVGFILPVKTESASARLKLIASKLSKIKKTGAYGAYALLARFDRVLPRRVQRWLAEVQARRTHFICTTVPGPRNKQYLAGIPILAHYGFPALMKEHGAAFSFLSYAKELHVAAVVDPAVIPDPTPLLDHVGEEIEELLAEAKLKYQR